MAARARQTFNSEILVVPDPVSPDAQILIQRDPKTGLVGIFFTKDKGKTFNTLLPLPTDQDPIGSVPVNTQGGIKWTLPPSPDLSNVNPTYIDSMFVGGLTVNQIFGFFKVPASVSYRAVEIQASLQTAADTPVTIDIVNSIGVAQGKTLTIPSGARSASIIFPSPLLMPSRSSWWIKILQAGLDLPGEQLQTRIVLNG